MTNRRFLMLAVTVFAWVGLGCSGNKSAGDISGGPLMEFAVNEDYAWCEDLEAQGIGIDANADLCQFKYLDRGYAYWADLASVAFVGQVEPDCDDGDKEYCLPSEFGEDCLVICPLKLNQVSRVLFGNPQSIETLATLEREQRDIDGDLIDAFHADGNYPSPWWKVAPGDNLIFAHRACYAQRYVGYDGLFLVVGIYPIRDGLVRDADDRSILVDDLRDAFDMMDLNIDEAADYSSRCDIESFQVPQKVIPPPSENAPEPVMNASKAEQ